MFRITASKAARTVVGPSQRAIHHSTPAYTVTEKAKQVASDVRGRYILLWMYADARAVTQVNIKVGQTLASGIETGEKVTEKTKESLGYQAEEAKDKTKQTADTAQHKANKVCCIRCCCLL